MLTADEFRNAIDSHLKAAMQMGERGHIVEATKMLGAVFSMAWDITRPNAGYQKVDCSDRIPDGMRHLIKSMEIVLVTDEDGKAIMMWGEGLNSDGNDDFKGALSKENYDEMMALIDSLLEEHFPDVDKSNVVSHEDFEKKSPMTTAHIGITKEAIDQAAEEFNEEFDRLFETWGGGDGT